MCCNCVYVFSNEFLTPIVRSGEREGNGERERERGIEREREREIKERERGVEREFDNGPLP